MGRQISKSILASLSLASLCSEAQNLSFELPADPAAASVPGWETGRRDRGIRVDDGVAEDGRFSLLLETEPDTGGIRFASAIDADSLTTTRLRIGAYLLKEDPAAAAGLWARVRGPDGWLHIARQTLDAGLPTMDWIAVTLDLPIAPTAIEISFGGEAAGGGRVRFDNFTLTAVDPATLAAPSRAAGAYLERALDILETNSVRRAQLDWTALRNAARLQNRGAGSEADAALATQFAVALIGDGHSYFMSSGQMNRLDAGPVSNARTGRPIRAPSGNPLAGGLAYVTVPGFAGGSQHAQSEFAASLQRIVAGLDAGGACGWVIDLRGNRGGNLWPMLAGIGPLLEPGEAGAALYPDGTRQSFWYRDGRVGLGDYTQLRVNDPYTLKRREAPVAVLTDRATASAAEILTVALRARANVRSFGEPTRGAHSATRVFPLSDAAAIVLAVAATVNARGESFDGPIVPDVAVTSSEADEDDGATARDAAIDAAVDWLATGSACTP